MRAVVQRVTSASVTIENECVGQIGVGLVVLLGVETTDLGEDARYLAEKVTGLRIFDDDQGKMNRSLIDLEGGMLVVSQFTLLGDCRRGRRPSFIAAAEPALAERLYLLFVSEVQKSIAQVATGRFRAQMAVSLVNDGPVTFLLDSRREF